MGRELARRLLDGALVFIRRLVLPASILLLACEAPIASKQRDTDDGSGSGTTAGEGADASTDAAPGEQTGPAVSSGGASEDDGAASAGHDGAGGGSGGGTGDPGPTGRCAEPCEEDADCCPFGVIGCPGADYPANWSCIEGACTFGGCRSDDDCDGLLGLGPEACRVVAGVPTCVAPCDGGGCGLGTQCVGQADDGTTFCAAPDDAPCEDDQDCDGAGTCIEDAGTCACASEADCAEAGMVCAGT